MKLYTLSIMCGLLINFTYILNGLKLPNHCLIECTSFNKNIENYFFDKAKNEKEICSQENLKNYVLMCLEENCETPSFKKLNVQTFLRSCQKYGLIKKKDNKRKDLLVKTIPNINKSNSKHLDLIKRSSCVGEGRNPKIQIPNQQKHKY